MNQYQPKYIFHTIQEPIITDKTTKLLEKNQYCFKVNHKATKTTIKEAIEHLFKVRVLKINTYHAAIKKRKVGRFNGYKKHYKKAIVTLSNDNKINLFSDQ